MVTGAFLGWCSGSTAAPPTPCAVNTIPTCADPRRPPPIGAMRPIAVSANHRSGRQFRRSVRSIPPAVCCRQASGLLDAETLGKSGFREDQCRHGAAATATEMSRDRRPRLRARPRQSRSLRTGGWSDGKGMQSEAHRRIVSPQQHDERGGRQRQVAAFVTNRGDHAFGRPNTTGSNTQGYRYRILVIMLCRNWFRRCDNVDVLEGGNQRLAGRRHRKLVR